MYVIVTLHVCLNSTNGFSVEDHACIAHIIVNPISNVISHQHHITFSLHAPDRRPLCIEIEPNRTTNVALIFAFQPTSTWVLTVLSRSPPSTGPVPF